MTHKKVEGSATTAEFDSYAARYEELLTHSIKFSGENPKYFAAYKASYIGRLLISEPCRVLDYGCGIGMLSRQLKLRFPNAQVDGFDPSLESIARVDTTLLAQGTFTSDPQSLGDDYDLIVMANVLHHVIPGERQNLVSQVAARLAIGGNLVIFEHNPWNPFLRWAVAQCPFDEDAILLRRKETAGYLTQTGLQTRHDYIVFFPRWLSFLRRLESLLLRFPLGAQYAVHGQKLFREVRNAELSARSHERLLTGVKRG